MNIQKMMKQAQQMQQKIGELQAELETRETEGAAGGGMVKVTLNGKGALLRISLDPAVIDKDEKEVLEDLIVAAFSDAKAKVDSSFNDEMGRVAGGMDLPGGLKLPF
ncbi:MAG: YbaB/EbfC family nucleoid-associated protein [Rickettsiales bacterium]|nr:YbaB/EbfC family nucleoid-associated protein [Rickettsiales bacterium]